MLKKIADKILNANRVCISFHASPDGDALGSALSLLCALRGIGKESYISSRDSIGDNFLFLPLSHEVNGEIPTPKSNDDLVVICDCGNTERISADLSEFTGEIINIDHHLSNDKYGVLNYVDTNAAATAEIIYELIPYLGVKLMKGEEVTSNIIKCIYSSLLTDTGSFRHSNVTKTTHKIAGELRELGVNNSEIFSNIFENIELNTLRLQGYAFSNFESCLGDKLIVCPLPKKVLTSLSMEKGDTGEIVSKLLAISTASVAAVLKEVDDGVKISLRSKFDVDVRKVAEAYGGGGHIKAAGLMLKNLSLEEAKEIIINQIEKVI